MVAGQRVYVTEDTEAAYYIRARAVKAGMIREAASTPKDTLRQLIEKFIDDNEAVLSPSTVPAYRSYARNAFGAYMGMSAASIPWQRAVSEEAGRVAAKTLENEWRLVTAALRYAKITPPDVNLPRGVKHERAFLDFEQIEVFIGAIRGDPCELAYLLALHSLRLSEILALREITDQIRVRGAMVRGEAGYVVKALNKTDLSRRDVPVMIPRVKELPLPVTQRDTTLNRHLAQQDVDEDVERMRAYYEAVSKSVSKFDS
jgi:integrase